MDAKLRRQIDRSLEAVDEHAVTGPRLIDDARRLHRRVKALVAMKLVPAVDGDALELACFALQHPMTQRKSLNLRDRAEQAAEILVSSTGPDADEKLLDKVTRILQELPQRAPKLDEARILSDALNLEDFGVTGMMMMAIQLARQGSGVAQIIEGCDKREQYGYWDARLKDSFHFEPSRKMAKHRLQNFRATAKLLANEVGDAS